MYGDNFWLLLRIPTVTEFQTLCTPKVIVFFSPKLIHTWHWIGVGWVYSDFLIAPISCSSKLKCAKLMDGLVGRAPETWKAITQYLSVYSLNIVSIWWRSLGRSTNYEEKPKENMRPNWLKINVFLYLDLNTEEVLLSFCFHYFLWLFSKKETSSSKMFSLCLIEL